MVLKSSTSVQETSAEKNQAELKRKLTGPPRLLFGKSKANNDLDTREVKGGIGSDGTHKDIIKMKQSTTIENKSQDYSEDLQKPAKSEEEWTAPKIMIKSEGSCTGNEKIDHSQGKFDHKKQSKPRGWKRLFSPSLICMKRRRKKLVKMSAMDGAVTFHNAQSAEFDCDTELATGQTVSPKEKVDVQISKNQEDTNGKTTTLFSGGTRCGITKLISTSTYHQNTKGLSGQEVPFGYEDSLNPNLSLRKKIRCFLKCGTEKHPPFFHEKLARNHKYIEEETIVLSNRHADDSDQRTIPYICEGEHSMGDNEVRGPCSESMTVNVDVSVEGEEAREVRQTSRDIEAYVNHTNASGQGEKREDSQRLAEEEIEACEGKMQDPFQSDEQLQGLTRVLLIEEIPRENVDVQGVSATIPSAVGTRKSLKHPFKQQDKGISLDDDVHESYLVEEVPHRRFTGEDSMQINLKNVKFESLELCHGEMNSALENGPDVSSEENLCKGENGCQQALLVEELGSQGSDVLLVQTACALVQAAMEAALKQLTEELKDRSANLTEYYKSQDHT